MTISELSTPPIMTFYQYSDEKTVAKVALRKIFQGRVFNSSLDVGSGTGELADVLVQASLKMTLLEKLEFYEDILRKRHPKADVVIQSVNTFPLQKYDCILYSHGLYYQPSEIWFDVCKNLYDALNPGGVLVLVMNRDKGAWWEAVNSFRDQLTSNMGFHYQPWSQFTSELKRLGPHKSAPYSYVLKFPSLHDLVEYKLHACLSIRDPLVKDRIRPRVYEMYKELKQNDGQFELFYESEILVFET